MPFAVGSLVRARGREWVVLPESEEELLVLRPLGGTDQEVTGIYVPLETVEPPRSAFRIRASPAIIVPAACCATQCASDSGPAPAPSAASAASVWNRVLTRLCPY